MKIWRIVPVLALAVSGVVASAGSATAAAPPPGGTYTCNGQSNEGIIPPGTYNSMLITGVCYMTYGTIVIRGNLTVAPGALLDGAATLGDPPPPSGPPPLDYSGILPGVP
jgi:hypothetical protein